MDLKRRYRNRMNELIWKLGHPLMSSAVDTGVLGVINYNHNTYIYILTSIIYMHNNIHIQSVLMNKLVPCAWVFEWRSINSEITITHTIIHLHKN